MEGVENNRTALQEVDKFKHGEEMEALRRRTARRLGLHPQRLTPGGTRAHTCTIMTLRVHAQLFFFSRFSVSIECCNSPSCRSA